MFLPLNNFCTLLPLGNCSSMHFFLKNVHINVAAECFSLCLASLTYMMCLRLMQGHMLYFHVLAEGSVVYMLCHFFSHHLLMDV